MTVLLFTPVSPAEDASILPMPGVVLTDKSPHGTMPPLALFIRVGLEVDVSPLHVVPECGCNATTFVAVLHSLPDKSWT